MAIIYGTTLDDILNATVSADSIYGYEGNNVLNGGSGTGFAQVQFAQLVNPYFGDRTISAANFLVVA
ncbi:hypothetical protein H6G33_14105 [Calothrix sp. FACHB-1219]|uniref:hypothetical protein n=1 Tax=unclassified Calothrix TaxID=2619626 RepID=UPI0016856478|nr:MULTISPECIES: hypothetical protein [unclassified Calothrix]MBD2205950.1 hypothetical protein [Calothrix sp. FACHB-168]MBD2218168.1 hypothetical protein [Calothrix sp. FACHB-1219]